MDAQTLYETDERKSAPTERVIITPEQYVSYRRMTTSVRYVHIRITQCVQVMLLNDPEEQRQRRKVCDDSSVWNFPLRSGERVGTNEATTVECSLHIHPCGGPTCLST